jgi:hypothetical protein
MAPALEVAWFMQLPRLLKVPMLPLGKVGAFDFSFWLMVGYYNSVETLNCEFPGFQKIAKANV